MTFIKRVSRACVEYRITTKPKLISLLKSSANFAVCQKKKALQTRDNSIGPLCNVPDFGEVTHMRKKGKIMSAYPGCVLYYQEEAKETQRSVALINQNCRTAIRRRMLCAIYMKGRNHAVCWFFPWPKGLLQLALGKYCP